MSVSPLLLCVAVDMTDVSEPTQSSVDSGLGGESRPSSDHLDGVAPMETSPPAPAMAQEYKLAPPVLESSLNASASTLVATSSNQPPRSVSPLPPPVQTVSAPLPAAMPMPDPR